ncbi:MAG: calcium-transporting ATPase [Nitrospirae bacterium]|nr:calcium-transporting ATPase [Nitrospirota bacterium]
MNWHQKNIAEVFHELASSPDGITEEEARTRIKRFGENVLKEKEKKTLFMIFLDQFRDFMILVLIAAAVISGVIGELSDTIAIIVIVVLNAVIGFAQEYRAEKAMAALKKMAAPYATVLRQGTPADIPSAGLVPGDVVLLEAGKIVPADMRLTEVAQLKLEEAALTGESVSVEKDPGALRIDNEVIPLGDRKNMVYKGTTVSYGRGRGIVVSTGMNTEIGKIAAMLQEEEEGKTPLQKRLAAFGKKLAIAVIALCAIIFGVGIIRGEPPLVMLLTAISLAVAAIPEALPAVVTISLAIGAKKMVKQNALIRKLPAVETLGSVTFICTDKTGTLTQNKMSVEEIWVDGKIIKSSEIQGAEGSSAHKANLLSLDPFTFLMVALTLNNDAISDREGQVKGDPTEVALLRAAKDAAFDTERLIKSFPRVAEIPFDSERKCMTTIHEESRGQESRDSREASMISNPSLPPFSKGEEGGFVCFTKGAIDALLNKSSGVLTSEGRKPLDVQEITDINDRMAADGLRVIGIAMRGLETLPLNITPDSIETDLVILGLVGLMDPPREEAKDAVASCKTAGIRPVMITGDHPITAKAIANRLGILDDDQRSVMTGKMLEELSLEEFEEKVEKIRVYARVAPDQKLKIIKALQDKGQFVAMTGDGVNDAPALKRADIGVAMGITGTDVAKEASHMILLDDNFATIVRAVKEGRRIFDNIRKFIRYTMTSNSGEIWTIFLAPFFGLPIPLLPIHILWINLVTDGLPGLALAAEPAEKNIMERPPRNPQENIFTGMWVQIIWVGLLMGAVSIFTQAWAIETGIGHWQTMVFTVLCFNQMGNVLALRSERESLFSQGLFSNRPLVGAFLLTVVLQMATIYVPFLNPIFKTQPLSAYELLITLGLSSIVFLAVESEKVVKRRKNQ